MNNQRFFCSIIIIAFAAIILSACGTRGETAPSEVSVVQPDRINVEQGDFLRSCDITKPRSTSPYGSDYQPQTDYHYMESGLGFLSASSSQDGYYYICASEGGNYLYFLPKDSDQPIALCNKPNCLHEKREDPQGVSDQEWMQQKLECNAFINDVDCIVYYNGAVYALGNLDPMSNDQALYKISLDGTKKEVVHQFHFEENYDENGNWNSEDLTFLMHPFQIHRGYLYYVLVKPEKMVLCRNKIDRLDDNPEIMFEYSNHGSYPSYILYSNYLFVKDNKNENSDTFIRIELDTLKQKDTGVLGINSIFEGKLVCSQNDGTTLRDLDGNIIKKISDDPASTARGGYIITYNMDDWTQEDKIQPFYLYDGNGDPAGKIEITGSSRPDPVAGDGDRIFFGVYSDDLEYGYLDLTKEPPEFHSFYKFLVQK